MGRLHELDGLRGLAALQVMVGHYGVLPAFIATPLDGAAAVILFFVLSGYVLSLPFFEGREINVLDFYIRRVFRIYPVMWVSLTLCIFLGFTTDPWNLLRQAILILEGIDFSKTNAVLWSLSVEMRLSLLMPAIIILLRHSNISARNIMQVGLVAAISLPLYAVDLTPLWVSVFGSGTIIARYRSEIKSWILIDSKRGAIVCVASVMGYLFASTFPGVYYYKLYVLMVSASSVGLIITALNFSMATKILSSRIPVFLGFVSYSVYLFHNPIHNLVIIEIPDAPSLTTAFISSIATLSIAYLGASMVERPAIKIGALFARLLTGSLKKIAQTPATKSAG